MDNFANEQTTSCTSDGNSPVRTVPLGDPCFEVVEKKENFLGRGGMGIVYKAKFCGKDVAAKMAHVFKMPEAYFEDEIEEIVSQIHHEVKIHSNLSNPFLVPLIATVVDANCNPKWILSEYYPLGSLDAFIERCIASDKKIPKKIIVSFMKDILSAIAYLHESNIIHRDIKPENVLISENGTCKVGDFGISRIVETISAKTHVGTPLYLAPEIIANKSYSIPVDIWSFGVLSLKLILRKFNTLDFQGKEKSRAAEEFPGISYILSGCLCEHPSQRLTANSLLQFLQKSPSSTNLSEMDILFINSPGTTGNMWIFTLTEIFVDYLSDNFRFTALTEILSYIVPVVAQIDWKVAMIVGGSMLVGGSMIYGAAIYQMEATIRSLQPYIH